MSINLTYTEITMISSVAALFATDNVNIFYLLFVVSIMSAFFKICLSEKRIEDLKELTSGKRDTLEQSKQDTEWFKAFCKRLWRQKNKASF